MPSEEQVIEACKPGQILHLYCGFTNPPKDKFLVVVQTEPLWLLIINSVIHSFVQKNQTLLNCQVKIDCAAHTFLEYDSYIDCSKIIDEIEIDRVHQILTYHFHNSKGKISDAVKTRIIEAVTNNPLLSSNEKEIICNNLS